jgi:hypothetical protein
MDAIFGTTLLSVSGPDDDDGKGGNPPTGDGDDGRPY